MAMHLIVLILFGAISFTASMARAVEPLLKVTVDGHVGYIVPAEYCQPPDSFFRNQVGGFYLEINTSKRLFGRLQSIR